MKSSGAKLFFVLLIVLVILFLVAKPNPEWVKSQLDKVELNQKPKEIAPVNQTEVAPVEAPKPVPVAEEKVTNVTYQWTDAKGNIQFTETPPVDRPYKTMSIQTKKGTQPRKALPSPYSTTQSLPITQSARSNTTTNKATASSSAGNLSMLCKNRFSAIQRYEKKLLKEKNVASSIWLQDYCSALAEFIHEDCVIPKSEVKYNAYCPLRLRR